MKVSPKTKNSMYVFTCTAGHLNSSFVPPWRICQFVLKKILMPRGRPGGRGGATAGND